MIYKHRLSDPFITNLLALEDSMFEFFETGARICQPEGEHDINTPYVFAVKDSEPLREFITELGFRPDGRLGERMRFTDSYRRHTSNIHIWVVEDIDRLTRIHAVIIKEKLAPANMTDAQMENIWKLLYIAEAAFRVYPVIPSGD